MKIDKYGNLVEETAEDLAQAKIDNEKREADIETQKQAKETNDALKASAKAKLIAGEALTEEEANTIVL